MRYLKNRKAFSFVVSAIVVFGFLLTTISVVMLHRYRINIYIIENYRWEYISNLLPTVLSSTHNGKQVSELFGEYLALGSAATDEDVKNVPQILKTKLDLILGKYECYKLSAENFELKSDGWDNDYCKTRKSLMTTARVTLPYSSNPVKEVILLSKSPSLSYIGE